MFRSLMNWLLNIYTVVFLLLTLWIGWHSLDTAISSSIGWQTAYTAISIVLLLYIALHWQNKLFPVIVYLSGLYYFRTEIFASIGWPILIAINAIALLLCWQFGPRYMAYRRQYLAKHRHPPL